MIDLTALLIMWAAIALFFGFLIFAGWAVRRAEERDIRTYREWEREKAARPENRRGA